MLLTSAWTSSEKTTNRPLHMDGLQKLAGKVSAESAGYMELEGAEKDADCQIVKVEGGVSSDRGCCNLFDPEGKAKKFSCGNCEYVQIQEAKK
jgi:hypothetical protein